MHTSSHYVNSDIELPEATILWRYLDLPKYIDLLRTCELYLQRADKFSDRFEGALTPLLRKTINHAHENNEINYDADEFYRRCRMCSYVNCWSLGAWDNMALWQLYGGASTSVAITTTVKELIIACLQWNENVIIKKVEYINHFKNPDMVIGFTTDLLQFKHEAYEFEREVRILVPRKKDEWQNNPEAIRLPLQNLNDLIRSVVVAPEAEPWFFDLIVDITRRYDVNATVSKSVLTCIP